MNPLLPGSAATNLDPDIDADADAKRAENEKQVQGQDIDRARTRTTRKVLAICIEITYLLENTSSSPMKIWYISIPIRMIFTCPDGLGGEDEGD